MSKIKLNAVIALFVVAGFTTFASAQTSVVKGTVDVRLTIVEACTINGGELAIESTNQFGILDFGTHALGTKGDQEAGNSNNSTTTGLSINVECTADYPNFKIRLADSKNTGYSVTANDRKMLHTAISGSEVQYAVYNEEKSAIIKDGDLVSAKPLAANTPTEYRLHATANLVGSEVAGTYTDVLNLEITF